MVTGGITTNTVRTKEGSTSFVSSALSFTTSLSIYFNGTDGSELSLNIVAYISHISSIPAMLASI